MKSRLCASAALWLVLACGNGGNGNAPPPVDDGSIPVTRAAHFEAAFGGEAFANPLKLVQHPSDDDRWYVVEQRGRIFTFLASDPAGTRSLVLDIETLLNLGNSFEEGLLSLAFDPDFGMNGQVFLSYVERVAVGRFQSVVARHVSGDGGLTIAPVAGDPTVIRFDQQQRNHNGGDIAFGPDGFLYYAMGDGGGGGDPDPEDGQNVQTLFGTIMRLDVANPPYGIPADNPFANSNGADEIYAYGFRNPWRMSFDSATGELWVGDVGQDSREEIDRVVRGGNYGWDCREGDLDFDPDPNCMPPYIEPEVVHPRDEAQSITGGHVYRGTAIPALAGAYVYGDFATGRVFAWYFEENPPRLVEVPTPDLSSISSFGQGRDGEIYALSFASPSIHRLLPGP